MNETNIRLINESQIFDDVKMGIIDGPPFENINLRDYSRSKSDNQIHFYIKYDYFPIKNFGTLNKTVNELYELVYFILYNEKVDSSEILVLEIAKTGNSIDLVVGLFEKLNPSKKAITVLIVVIALISAIGIYDNHNQKIVENKHTEYKIGETKAQTLKARAETAKIQSEQRKIELENILLKNKITKDSIEAINTEENRKKISRKQRSIQRSVMQKPITQTVINGTVIYNNLSVENP